MSPLRWEGGGGGITVENKETGDMIYSFLYYSCRQNKIDSISVVGVSWLLHISK